MTYEDLCNYWLTYSTAIPEIKHVIIGQDERISDHDASKVRYPCMWVETPDVAETGGDQDAEDEFIFNVVVLCTAKNDSEVEERRALSTALTIMNKVRKKYLEDAEDLFDIPDRAITAKKEPIAWMGSNVEYGWRRAFIIKQPIDNC